jgi:hypothetical protein
MVIASGLMPVSSNSFNIKRTDAIKKRSLGQLSEELIIPFYITAAVVITFSSILLLILMASTTILVFTLTASRFLYKICRSLE